MGLSPLAAPVWRITFLENLHYPWRFLWIPAALLVLPAASTTQHAVSGEECAETARRYRFFLGFFIACGAVYIGGGFYTNSPHRFTDNTAYSEENIRETTGFYITAPFHYHHRDIPAPPPFQLNVTSGDATVTDYDVDKGHHLRFAVDAENLSGFSTNIAYFPGWTLTVDGEKHKPDFNKTPFIEFAVPPGEHIVDLKRSGTVLQKLADCISATTLAAFLTICVLFIRRNRDRKIRTP